jgi:cytoskeletal protein RodZ
LIESLSSELIERRRLLGLTREEAYKKFRVPLGFLIAIEEGRLDELPAAVYARGFLKSYCEGLGLAPEPRVDALDETMHRRQKFRAGFLGRADARPKWVDDAMMWAAIVGIVLFAWIAYSVVVQPGDSPHGTGVHADTLDLRGEDPFAAP